MAVTTNIAILFLLYAFVQGYSDCGSQVGKLSSLKIPGCNEDQRCILKRGTNATVEIDFAIKEETDTVKAVVHGIILGVPVAFQLPNPDGCKDSGLQCPLSAGTQYHYKATLPVLKKYPKVTVNVKWELQDKDGNDIVCGLIPVKIQ